MLRCLDIFDVNILLPWSMFLPLGVCLFATLNEICDVQCHGRCMIGFGMKMSCCMLRCMLVCV